MEVIAVVMLVSAGAEAVLPQLLAKLLPETHGYARCLEDALLLDLRIQVGGVCGRLLDRIDRAT
jgi:hypothetical protein